MPAPDVYRHAAPTSDVPPDRLALVASHARDTHGAHQAGPVTGWVGRLESRIPDIFSPPNVAGADLVAVVDGRLVLPSE